MFAFSTQKSARSARQRCAALTAAAATLSASMMAPEGHAQDFNGDGFADLVVGVPLEDVGAIVDAGCVNVIYGAAGGLSGTIAGGAPIAGQLWHQDRPGIVGVCAAGDLLGSAMATGDFDGDGFDDVAICAPGKTLGGAADAGYVHVIYGSPGGLSPAGNLVLTQAFFGEAPEAGDSFGAAIASGDFNGDGVDDLAIGAPNEDLGAADCGMVNVAFGRAGGGFALPAFPIIVQPMFGNALEPLDYFGSALACGDFDLDGFDDLVIGVPGQAVGAAIDAGMIHVAYGVPAGPVAGPIATFVQPMLGDPAEFGDMFGSSLATGDFDASGTDDLAVGVPFEDFGGVADTGAVSAIGGAPGAGLVVGMTMTFTQGTFGVDVDERRDRFGTSLTAGDFNGDLFDDLAVGALWEALPGIRDAGQVAIIPGGPGGPGTGPAPSIWNQNSPSILESAEPSDWFGRYVSTADFDGDGFADLAVGVPGENIGAAADCGCVNVLYGAAAGVSGAGDQLWHQNRPGIPESNQAMDLFGTLGQ